MWDDELLVLGLCDERQSKELIEDCVRYWPPRMRLTVAGSSARPWQFGTGITFDAVIIDQRLAGGPNACIDIAGELRRELPYLPLLVVGLLESDWQTARLHDLRADFLCIANGRDFDFAAWVQRSLAPHTTGFAWRQEQPPIASAIRVIDANLLGRIWTNPDELYALDPLDFESLVAELFAVHGFAVELTKRSRDGGVDIFAVRRDIVSSLYVVQCKRYRAERRVEVAEVRRLLGVRADLGATKAVIATTSQFTAPARQLEQRHRWELELKDHDELAHLLGALPVRRPGS